jgi:dienelactone hydrolase
VKRLARALLLLLAGSALAQQAVQVPSLDRVKGEPVVLPGLWFAAPGSGRQPAMVLLHGCGGAFNRRGELDPRLHTMAGRLNARGIGALVLDSLAPRGEKELCTQREGTRQVTMRNRRRDALGGLQWLAAQPGVDAGRLGLMGWSNGGSTVLAASNHHHPEVAASPVQPALAIAFYPGCAADLKRGYEAAAPLLIMIGSADDWTPAGPCEALAREAKGPAPSLEVYPGAYHGFDGNGPVHLRKDVPNGTHPGAGVHLGSDPAAKAASALRVDDFLNEHWPRPAPPANMP